MIRTAILALGLAGCAAASPAEGAVRVLLFLSPECPISDAFAPEIGRLAADYAPRGVDFIRVYTDAGLSEDRLRQHTREYALPGELLRDPDQALASRHGVRVTPEAVVLDRRGARVYRGRIDDRYLAPGRYRLRPTTRELRDALDAVLDGVPVAVPETDAAGCPLTRRSP